MKMTHLTALAISIVASCVLVANAKMQQNGGKEIMFSKNKFVAKGGVGIVNRNLYIILNSERNQLKLGPGNRWEGQFSKNTEVVIVYDGKVFSQQALPNDFDLNKSVIISFETDRVRFFDFEKMDGGFYSRVKSD